MFVGKAVYRYMFRFVIIITRIMQDVAADSLKNIISKNFHNRTCWLASGIPFIDQGHRGCRANFLQKLSEIAFHLYVYRNFVKNAVSSFHSAVTTISVL